MAKPHKCPKSVCAHVCVWARVENILRAYRCARVCVCAIRNARSLSGFARIRQQTKVIYERTHRTAGCLAVAKFIFPNLNKWQNNGRAQRKHNTALDFVVVVVAIDALYASAHFMWSKMNSSRGKDLAKPTITLRSKVIFSVCVSLCVWVMCTENFYFTLVDRARSSIRSVSVLHLWLAPQSLLTTHYLQHTAWVKHIENIFFSFFLFFHFFSLLILFCIRYTHTHSHQHQHQTYVHKYK